MSRPPRDMGFSPNYLEVFTYLQVSAAGLKLEQQTTRANNNVEAKDFEPAGV
jgi:hypothetical protein